MPGACLSLWSTDACESSIAGIWDSSDLVERGVFLGLALMLAYTVFFVIRFSRRYYLARREFQNLKSVDLPNFSRANSILLANLSPGLGTLRGIASAAPFLGLTGTCYAILAGAFVGFGMEKQAAIRALIIGTAASLRMAAAGIVVAIPAAFSYSMIRARVETLRGRLLPHRKLTANNLGSFQFAQTLPLTRRFVSSPPYALIAAPALACVVMMYMAFKPYTTPVGLAVALPSTRCNESAPDRLIVLRVTNSGELFLNMEPLRWEECSNRLATIYRSRANRELLLYAEDGVSFQTAANAIDLARNSPPPGPDSLDIKVILVTPERSRECAPRPVRPVPVRRAFR